MTMSKMKWKLMLFGVVVACAFGGIALRFAWATPSQGFSSTFLSGPVVLDEIDIKNETDTYELEMKTKGLSDVYVLRNVFAPGGHSGWHSHPGPSIVSVVSGQATEYRDDDPNGVVHLAGTAFVDEGGDHAHMVVNEGSTDLVLVAFQIIPRGATRRIDRPAP
jgi:quercetin dioxygenase-like cupin family protein